MRLTRAVRIHIIALALLAVCGLFHPATVRANDLQSGDLLIGAGVPCCFGSIGNGAILLVRNGSVSVFCESPASASDPGYFGVPIAVIADSQGNAVFLAEVGTGLPVFGAGTALLSCSGIGATAQMLGYFPSTAATAPAYPVPVIPGVLDPGATFVSNGAEAQTASALHLIRLNTVSLTDLAAGVTTQDAYSLAVATAPGTAVAIRYRATDQIWEADTQVINMPTGSIQIDQIDSIEHSGATYSTNGDNIEKALDPLTVEASGTILGTSFNLTLNLFGSANTFPPTPVGGQPAIEYNTAIPQTPSGCSPPAPPLDNSMPTNATGSLLIPFVGGGIANILYDEFTGFGLIATTEYGPSGGPWLTNISEDLLDNPGDPTQYFQDGFAGCQAVPYIPMSVPLPYDGVDPPPAGYAIGASVSYKPASSVNGPVGVQFSSIGPGGTQVIGLAVGTNAPIVVTGAQLTAAGFADAIGIGAYPNGVSAGTGLTVVLRIDSPVNILITDPNGNQLGVDSLGNTHNDFTGTIVNSITGGSENFNNGFDSGPGEPRFFAINNPVPGTYNVQSIGTGSGPYTVHVYSVNLANPVGQAISTSGTASVGSVGNENFTLDAMGNIAFTVAPTTTALMISPGSATFGAPVTFTAAVTATNSTSNPTGTVTFYNGATSLGSGTVGSNGMATFMSSTLTAGPYSVTAQYSGDSANAASTSLAQPLTITQATPVITWATPAAITYGTPLSAAQLDATANVTGTFVYSPASGTVLTAGPQMLNATFTPTDSTDYTTANASVPLTVNKAASSITWATPAAITYGTPLSASQLDASANVPGTFVYSPAAGTVLTAGPQMLNVTFTPTDVTDDSTATASVILTVNKVTPVITWATPAAITYGTALSASQLDASANVPGTFAYSPAAGAVLAAGSQTLNATFTPTDTTDYNTATASVTLQVNPAPSGGGFTITPIPPQENALRGDIAAFILEIKSVQGFNGNVTLSCSGGPTGSKCVDLPMTVRVDGTALAISGILFPDNSTPGVYTITFTGVSGAITSTATATFTVK
jgi:Bacterial Ig-like domain (group 3)